MKKEILEFKENVINGVKDNFKTDGEIVPIMIFLEKTDEGIKQGFIPLGHMMQPNMKDLLSTMLHQFLSSRKVIATAFISEAWLKQFENQEEAKKAFDKVKEVGKMKDRKEVIIIKFEQWDSNETVTYDINRVFEHPYLCNENRVTGLDEGRFSNFLYKPHNFN